MNKPAVTVDEKYLFPFEETYQGYQLYKHLDPGFYKEMKAVFERTRRFAREKAAPLALYIDREMKRDPSNKEPIWEFVRGAGKAGLLSLCVPKHLGGSGMPFAAAPILWEEICSVCTGLGNILGGHFLGNYILFSTFSLGRVAEVYEEIVKAEKSDRPVVLSSAMTEPNVGSDHSEIPLYKSARTQCEAKPVKGGYLLNGTKHFISCGSISTYHVALMPTDRKRNLETMATFLVPCDSPGFSFGRDEHKMGQKATPASEMIYEDCFVPEKNRLSPDISSWADKLMDLLGFTRLCIGAIATGAARGAFERAATYARETRVRGDLLINHQWAQMVLADMLMNVTTARSITQEGLFSEVQYGVDKLFIPPRRGAYRMSKAMNTMMSLPMSRMGSDMLQRRAVRKPFGKALGWALDHVGLNTPLMNMVTSTAKAKCSDLAVLNANLGIDLMGKSGLRQDEGMEKILRDAKLLQIYEGTNEMCAFGIFQRALADRDPAIEMWRN